MNPSVIHILWSGTIGGMPRAVYQLVRAQKELSSYRPAVLFAQSGGHYFDLIRDAGVDVHELNLDRDRNVLGSQAAVEILRGYDIHHFHAAELSLMLASTRCRGARRVYTNRGGRIAYTGKQKWRYRLAGTFLRRSFHGFSGNTAHACDSSAALFGIDRERWQVTYNGLLFHTLDPRRDVSEVRSELGLDEHSLVVATSAALRDWKRIDRLIEAVARIRRQGLRLVILGDGPARAELEKLAVDRGIADSVRFPGMVRHVGDYLQLVDVFALPSDSTESFGNSSVEAMYHRIPTIIFGDGGGMVEHIEDGVSGYVVDSVDALAARIEALLDDADLRRRVGNAARAFVTSRYSLEQMIASYSKLYDSALGGRLAVGTSVHQLDEA